MKKTNVVLFDMDNTLVLADTVRLWANFLDQKGIMTAEDWQLQIKYDEDYREHRLDVVASFEFALTLLNKIPVELREEWRYACFDEMIKPRVSKVGLQLIQDYKAQPNTLVVLMTATQQFVASPVAAYVGVDDLIATEEEIHNQAYTGKVLGVPNIGEGKITKFQHWVEKNQITLAHTVFYSDSINDLPLLSQVESPIVVDPDHRLKAIAIQKNWEMVSFKAMQPVQAIDLSAFVYG